MELLFVNVYLPYFCNENYPDYLMCLGNISSILNNNNVNGIMIIGDFNAAIGSEFYGELECLCNEKNILKQKRKYQEYTSKRGSLR